MDSEHQTEFKQTELGVIPTDWEIIKLGELGELKNGVNFSRADFGQGLPIINVTNLFDGRHASINNLPEIKKDAVPNYKRYLVKKGDILFARSSLVHSGAGQAAMVNMLPNEETAFSGFIIRFRKRDDAKIDSEFLNYLVRSKIYRIFIPQILAGTAITNINQSILSALPIIVPPVIEQKAVVKIVSDIDSKIELNQQMNKTLEAIGQAVFKRWFVDFEFPNEEGKPYKSSGGVMKYSSELCKEIPKFWQVMTLDEISSNFDSRRVPLSGREREKIHGVYPYYGAAGVLDYVNKFLFDGMYVLMGEDGTVIDKDGFPVLQLVNGKFWVNNHAHVLQGKGVSTELLHLLLKNNNVQHIVTGAVQPKINQGNMNTLLFVVPDEACLERLQKLINELYAKTLINNEQNESLSKLRNILLPRLMSGKIRIPVNTGNKEMQ